MKRLFYAIVIFGSQVVNAQTSINIQNDLFGLLNSNSNILTKDGLIKGETKKNQFVSSFTETNYNEEFSIKVNASLEYEIGEIQSNLGTFAVMFLKIKDNDANENIEFLTIFKKSKIDLNSSVIDNYRLEWMSYCNSHEVEKLVKELYVPDAYYYNRGRLLKGTKALVAEYSYMNSPNYSLKLTPKQVTFVNGNIAYEIGRCSGSYPLPYMLVWQKQTDNSWKILLDSNY